MKLVEGELVLKLVECEGLELLKEDARYEGGGRGYLSGTFPLARLHQLR